MNEENNNKIDVYTIGFTKKSADVFFSSIKNNGVKRVIDVRLNNVSQLAGFAKSKDLKYFLKTICDVEYIHILDLAPTSEMLDKYKKHKGSWDVYQNEFLELMNKRGIEKVLNPGLIDGSCLLCSELQPTHCHRKLVIDYLGNYWMNLDVKHL